MGDHFVGLDLETSGTDHERHVPIQIGISFGQNGALENQRLLIGWPNIGDVGGPAWSEEAALIHRIPIESVRTAMLTPTAADAVCVDFCVTNGLGPNEGLPVGWNVGTFDMPFVRKHFPFTAALFSHRCVDLNSVAFSMAEAGRSSPRNGAQALGAKAWKKAAKAHAERVLGGEAEWHDALYDARASLIEWRYFTDRMNLVT